MYNRVNYIIDKNKNYVIEFLLRVSMIFFSLPQNSFDNFSTYFKPGALMIGRLVTTLYMSKFTRPIFLFNYISLRIYTTWKGKVPRYG